MSPEISARKFDFILRNWRFLGFGFLLTFTCNFGQTFFIGLYNGDIREAYGLTSGEFGTLYGAATLCSAGSLIWIGRLVDKVDLRIYTLCVIAGMTLACALMFSGSSILVLGVALALLRLCGQGLMPHISSTSMGRYFEAARGRAVSIAQLGISAGQVVLPLMATFAVAQYGWRESWGLYGLGLVVLIAPLALVLLKGHGERHREWESQMTLAESQTGAHSRVSTPLRKQVFRDKRIFLIIPGYLSMPLFGTSLLFFQDELLAAKGWGADLFAFSFPIYAVAMTLSSLSGGFIIDKVGSSLKVLPFMYMPFAVALVVLAVAEQSVWLPLMMVLIGASTGQMAVISGTLWPEMYGTRILGAVRALIVSIMVFGTAATPAIVGRLYDMGVSVADSYLAFAAYMVFFGLIQIPLGYGKRAKAAKIAD